MIGSAGASPVKASRYRCTTAVVRSSAMSIRGMMASISLRSYQADVHRSRPVGQRRFKKADGMTTLANVSPCDALTVEHLMEKLTQEKVYLEEEVRTEENFEEIIGASAALRRVLKAVETV